MKLAINKDFANVEKSGSKNEKIEKSEIYDLSFFIVKVTFAMMDHNFFFNIPTNF